MDHLAGNFLKRTLSLPHSSPLWIFWEWIPHGVQHDPLPANLSSSFAARMHLAFSYNPPPLPFSMPSCRFSIFFVRILFMCPTSFSSPSLFCFATCLVHQKRAPFKRLLLVFFCRSWPRL